MSKTKHGRGKSATKDRRLRAEPGSPVQKQAAPTPVPPRPAGQRLFDMPYSSQVPSPVRPDLGLASLVARAGHNAGYDIDLTLLDAADHRLIRTGLLLAHRVLDGRGEWYLGAPDWVPLLPKELIVPMGQGELPDDLAELVRPFRRGAPLSPVAALRCERREFALRNGGGQTVALLRDDKVTVRRNGLTTARYREVMLTPVGPGLDAAQAEWLGQCLGAAGGTEIERFPRLVRRLGAPATGPSDLPAPAKLADGTFGQFLTQLLGAGVRDLISGDLALTAGAPGAADRLVESAGILRSRLEGLRPVLGTDWVDEVVDDLDWLVAPVAAPLVSRSAASSRWPGASSDSDDRAALGGPGTYVEMSAQPADPDGYRARLRSLRYLSLAGTAGRGRSGAQDRGGRHPAGCRGRRGPVRGRDGQVRPRRRPACRGRDRPDLGHRLVGGAGTGPVGRDPVAGGPRADRQGSGATEARLRAAGARVPRRSWCRRHAGAHRRAHPGGRVRGRSDVRA